MEQIQVHDIEELIEELVKIIAENPEMKKAKFHGWDDGSVYIGENINIDCLQSCK